jgi:hypothetical protein
MYNQLNSYRVTVIFSIVIHSDTKAKKLKLFDPRNDYINSQCFENTIKLKSLKKRVDLRGHAIHLNLRLFSFSLTIINKGPLFKLEEIDKVEISHKYLDVSNF